MPQKITVYTNKYRASHGKDPRGFGRWYFEMPDGKQVSFTGYYSLAKPQAIAWAKKAGHTYLYVLG